MASDLVATGSVESPSIQDVTSHIYSTRSGSWKGLLKLWPEAVDASRGEVVEYLQNLQVELKREVQHHEQVIRARFGRHANLVLQCHAEDVESLLCKIWRK